MNRLQDKHEISSYEEKAKVLRENGWETWYNDDNWIKTEWIDQGKKVDMMGRTTDSAYTLEKDLQIIDDLVQVKSLNEEDFRYKNLDINSSPDLQMKLSELVRNVTLQTSVMSVLMEQRELAKINNKDNSKFFIILEKANLPVHSSSPRRLYQLISYTIIGFIASVSYIVAKIFYKNFSVVLKKIFQ